MARQLIRVPSLHVKRRLAHGEVILAVCPVILSLLHARRLGLEVVDFRSHAGLARVRTQTPRSGQQVSRSGIEVPTIRFLHRMLPGLSGLELHEGALYDGLDMIRPVEVGHDRKRHHAMLWYYNGLVKAFRRADPRGRSRPIVDELDRVVKALMKESS